MSKKMPLPPPSRQLRKRFAKCSMLRKYVRSRERYLYERDTQRISLPFDWGGELFDLAAGESAFGQLRAFAAEALHDSDRFFSYTPVSGYALKDGLLQFPSAVETAYPENNVVW